MVVVVLKHLMFGFYNLCVVAAAVCDFCKKKESELYQKEVGKMTADSIL